MKSKKYILNSIGIQLLLCSALTIFDYAVADSVSKVQIHGNQRIESETILSYTPIKPGVEFDDQMMDQALKDLFATGYFADVSIKKDAQALVINVVENASINKIAFEGNSKLKDDKLLEEIQLRPREVVSRSRILSAQQRILELYRQMGRFAVVVEPKIIKLDQNRIDLVFEINEGQVTYVRQINFIGNKAFSTSKLEKSLYTKKTRWYRFFATDDMYDPNRFAADQQALRQFYFDHGHPDFHIISAVSELTPDQKDFYLTFTIHEGPVYKIGKINIISRVAKVNPEKLRKSITIAEGDIFSGTKIEKSIEILTDTIGIQGYAFAEITPRIDKNREEKTVDITLEINEGQRAYVERIDIRNNDRTRDEVIRREISLQEGDAYNSSLLKRSEHALENLGYFKKVEMSTEQGSSPDKVVAVVKVEEQPTGELGASGGWSTLDGPLVNAKFSERNLGGTGYVVHADFTVAKRRQDFDIGVTNPYFLGYSIEAGLDIFRTRSTRLQTFTDSNVGISPHITYALGANLFQSWSYTLKKEKIGDIPGDVSEFIRAQRGSFVTSAVTHSIIYDRRNSRIDPTSGYSLSFSNTYAGLGSRKVAYLKNALSASFFYSPLDEVTFNWRTSYAHADKVNKNTDIRISDSFFIGADSFRGFEYGGLGPRDRQTGDSLGGTRFWVSTLEGVFPIGLPNEFGIKGAVFGEFGSVWRHAMTIPKNITFVNPRTGNTEARIADSRGVRGTVGVGLSWVSPFGPIRIDYGFPIMKKRDDRTQRITFGFTSRF